MPKQWTWTHVVIVASIGTILEWFVSGAPCRPLLPPGRLAAAPLRSAARAPACPPAPPVHRRTFTPTPSWTPR